MNFPAIGTRLEQVELFYEGTRQEHWRSELVTLRSGTHGPWWEIAECDHRHWSERMARECLKHRVRTMDKGKNSQ